MGDIDEDSLLSNLNETDGPTWHEPPDSSPFKDDRYSSNVYNDTGDDFWGGDSYLGSGNPEKNAHIAIVASVIIAVVFVLLIGGAVYWVMKRKVGPPKLWGWRSKGLDQGNETNGTGFNGQTYTNGGFVGSGFGHGWMHGNGGHTGDPEAHGPDKHDMYPLQIWKSHGTGTTTLNDDGLETGTIASTASTEGAADHTAGKASTSGLPPPTYDSVVPAAHSRLPGGSVMRNSAADTKTQLEMGQSSSRNESEHATTDDQNDGQPSQPHTFV